MSLLSCENALKSGSPGHGEDSSVSVSEKQPDDSGVA